MEILGIIDQLEYMVTSSHRLPPTHKVVLDGDKLLELVDQLRVAVPKEVQEADEVLRKRDGLLNLSLQEARRIRTTAESESRQMTDQHELVREATRRADDLMQETQKKAQRILDMAQSELEGRRNNADEYSKDVLYQLEEQVSNILGTIRRGIEVLDTAQQVAGAR